MVCTGLFVFYASFLALCLGWQNDYDRPLHFECGDQQYISRVKSRHSNHHEDRQWEYSCTPLRGSARLEKCTWYNHLNEYDQLLAFRCPGQRVITGVKSVHNNHYEDRVFGFRCCSLVKTSLNHCQITSFLNSYDRLMHYIVPTRYVIVGFYSAHSNPHEDRRWKAEICALPYVHKPYITG